MGKLSTDLGRYALKCHDHTQSELEAAAFSACLKARKGFTFDDRVPRAIAVSEKRWISIRLTSIPMGDSQPVKTQGPIPSRYCKVSSCKPAVLEVSRRNSGQS